MREEAGRIIIEPVQPDEYDIGVLVEAITDENAHAAVETGPPQGREAW